MKFGVVVFPGSNCDLDTKHVLSAQLGQEVRMLWHKQNDLEGVDVVILPGGFSYGDYLRTGAIARFSPIMDSVIKFASSGKPLLGICNGFQILVECELLPGALVTNGSLRFISDEITMRVESENSTFTGKYNESEVLRMPIAHIGGSYYTDADTVESLKENGQIAFKYCDSRGEVNDSRISGS